MSDSSAAPIQWARAYGSPTCSGVIKQEPSDFEVIEQLNNSPTGSGEHIWLSVRKTRQNTDELARQLARFAGVAYRDVGYSGLKDFHATTTQWFSVWKPKGTEPDWADFESSGVEILQVGRHNRKIKRGTHSANQFCIRIKQLSGDLSLLSDKLGLIAEQGVPNYFGEQRFGRNGNNIPQAQELFSGAISVKNRNHRSLLISAARSWIFNQIVSQRVEQGTWRKLYAGEPANLDGSASVFTSNGEPVEQTRLDTLDIHPTAAMWGLVDESAIQAYVDLHLLESAIANEYLELADGLVRQGLKSQRRAVRSKVHEPTWTIDGDELVLNFALQRGQYATSVLREIIDYLP